MGIITYDGKTSDTFGIRVEKCPDYNSAERKVEFISVEGRNGDLVRDTGAYNNVTQTYDVYFGDENSTFQELSSAVSMWLLGSKGYCRLEDDYFPDVYRLAVYNGMIQNRNFMNIKGRSVLQFNCKPQRFLKSGETWQTITTGDSFVNDYMPCYPVFEITGNGTVSYGSTTITVTNNASGVIYFDTELQDAYTGDISLPLLEASFDVTHTFPYGAVTPWSADVNLPSNWSDYSELYINWRSLQPNVTTGLYDLDMTQDISNVSLGSDWFLTKQVANSYITLTPNVTDPVTSLWGQTFAITGIISSLFNRNGAIQISGNVEPFATGATEVNHTVTALRIQPRTWTL